MKLATFLVQARTPIPGFIPMADAKGFILYTDGRAFFTAREDMTDIHRHAHRDAAVDDFRARAGLLKENRNAR